MKTINATQNPTTCILGYQAVCFFSLEGNPYPEENRFMETTAFTLQQMIQKLEDLHKRNYLEDPHTTEVTPIDWGISHKSHGGPLQGSFQATDWTGLQVTYYIYIKPLYKYDFGIPLEF